MESVDGMDQTVLEKLAVKAPLGLPLKDLLAAHTVDKLKGIAKAWSVKNCAKLRKQELIETLVGVILDPRRLGEQLILLDDEEYDFFNEISLTQQAVDMSAENTKRCLPYAHSLGYLYVVVDKQGIISVNMPPDLAALYHTVRVDEAWCQHIADYRLKWDYLQGLTWLYGIVPMMQVLELYNSNNHNQATAEDIAEVLAFYQARNNTIQMDQGYVFDERYGLDKAAAQTLLLKTLDQPRYLPDEDEILRLATDPVGENVAQQLPIEQYLMSHFETEEEDVWALTAELQISIHEEVELPVLMEIVGQYGFIFDVKVQKEKFAKLLIELVNHSRACSLGGYTPLELLALTGRALPQAAELKMPGEQPIHVEKIGRNDPCPCGSGKKYKKCCGK